MKCLVVDDSSLTRRILVNSLKQMGFETVLEAADAEAAITQCTADLALIMTDWNMPGMSGVDLVRKIRQDPALVHIPVLLVTARHIKDDMSEATRAGVSGFVVKPFTPDILTRKIQELMNAARPAADAPPEAATGTDG